MSGKWWVLQGCYTGLVVVIVLLVAMQAGRVRREQDRARINRLLGMAVESRAAVARVKGLTDDQSA